MTSFPPENRVVAVVEYSQQHMVGLDDHMVAVRRFPFVGGNPIRIPQLSCSGDSWFLFRFDTAAAEDDAPTDPDAEVEEEKKKQDVADSIERIILR
jgi:hypothetical protein